MAGFSAKPMSKKMIWNLARQFRKELNLETTFYFPVLKVVAVLADAGLLEYEIVENNELPPGVYARTLPEINTIEIRRDTYERAAAGIPRDRFTICHELGHWLLHTENCISFSRAEIPAYQAPEWQANEFAGEVMAPGYLIEGLSKEQISSYCGMSNQAAEKQYNKHNL